MQKAWLVLADGTRFEGRAFGARGTTVGEAVFTTGMTGYQEVLTDPSYAAQLVTLTAAHIGNTGINPEDMETTKPALAGFIIRERSPMVSNWRSTESLDDYLAKHNIVGICDIDTRALTRHLRDHGSQMAAIGTEDPGALHAAAKAAPPMAGQDLTDLVSTREIYKWSEGLGAWGEGQTEGRRYHVVAYDFGIKLNILRCLASAGFDVTVVPNRTTAEEVLALNPDGIFLSNGPGDPDAVTYAIENIRKLVGKKPIFGICLGHQLLALALGGTTSKMKFGHRGLNQPVKDLTTGKIEITTQNHGFVVDLPSLAGKCEATHVHLNDGTCEGIRHLQANAFSVQYHPEAAAGPHDSRYLFERFREHVAAATP